MRSKFVVRLLDEAGELLGWQAVYAEPHAERPGVFWVDRTEIPLERPGRATRISVHWTDLNVARMEPLIEAIEIPPEKVGTSGTFIWLPWSPLWQVRGEQDVPLPAVTERGSVRLSPDMGVLGGVGL